MLDCIRGFTSGIKPDLPLCDNVEHPEPFFVVAVCYFLKLITQLIIIVLQYKWNQIHILDKHLTEMQSGSKTFQPFINKNIQRKIMIYCINNTIYANPQTIFEKFWFTSKLWFEFWYWDQSFMGYMVNDCSDLVSTQVKQI